MIAWRMSASSFATGLAILAACCAGMPRSTSLAQDAASVTFTKDIAPLVFEHCAACHREGESAPFPLLTYEDVKSHAKQIAEVTASRYMPPWMPAPGHGEFIGERRLSDDEIQRIAKWVEAGTPQGAPGDLPAPPEFTKGWQLGEPDLVVTLPATYTLAADGLDVYRNFVVPIPIDRTRWVRATEFRPTNARPVHHAFVLIDPTSSSRRRDRLDEKPGFDGMSAGDAIGPGEQFISWQPGKTASPGRDDVAWRLNPGTDLVLQLHMQPTGKPEAIGASVGLFFADGPGTKHPQKLVLQSKDIDIPAGEANYRVYEQYRLPVDVYVLAVLPHAHYLARRMEAFARLPNGSQRWLLLIEDWDFNWQGDYRYKEPVLLPAGAMLTMQYTYDNSAANVRNPHQPPRRVTYGINSTDEMAELWLQVLPKNPDDLSYLQQDFGRHALTKRLEYHRRILERDSANVDARINLGHSLIGFGKLGEAEAHLKRAVELAPDSAEAHALLGYAYLRQQRIALAESELKRAVSLDAERFDALHDLGLLYLNRGDYADAEAQFKKAIEVSPYDAVTRSNMGLSLLHQRRIQEAVVHLEMAIDLNPNDQASRARLQQARQFLASDEGNQTAPETGN
jgi:Flp pilus assembly protein TadD/mono/diheme cytochrome c family protein